MGGRDSGENFPDELKNMPMKPFLFSCCLSVCTFLATGCTDRAIRTRVAEHPTTFCNPLNLDYRFMKIQGGAGIREAADPVVVRFKDKYFLFASKSSGYWCTDDFTEWKHIIVEEPVLPIEDYAPGIFLHDGAVFYVGSSGGRATLYKSTDPASGRWEKVKDILSYWDPAFLVEGDSLYLYYGSSPVNPIFGQTFRLSTLEETGPRVACLNSDTAAHGWERSGERHELQQRPYLEGAWMTRHNGRYYLQYAAPGTQWKTYADGVYVSASPMGPFTYAENSPVSYKPTGFIGGAGHGCLFQVGDNYWKAATNSISVRHWFERRLSFYPSGFTADGHLYTDTYLGDYPLYLPTGKKGQPLRPDWMLLSFRKQVRTSSQKEGQAAWLVDEDARTAWVAEGNGLGEWVEIDLGQEATVHAIQVNYDEYGATRQGLQTDVYQSYVLYASHDGKTWSVIADKRDKTTDTPHDYVEFEIPFRARYIKWQNQAFTLSDNVSLRELRVFGKGRGKAPERVGRVTAVRQADPCRAVVEWEPVEGAEGYIVRAGISPDCMHLNFQVTDSTRYDLTALNRAAGYCVAVDAYNANGLTRGKTLRLLPAE